MPSAPYVSRINQIDAAQLDAEIYNVLKRQTDEIIRACPPGRVDKWQPEINALLRFAIWFFSLRTSNTTFGQQLLNLNYANFGQRKAILYLLLTTVAPYLQERLADTRVVSDSERNDKIKFYVERIASVIQFLGFFNLLIFLHRGIQPRIIERLLNISSRTSTTHKPREIGYSYMTRELLWHGLIELFTVGIPMINFHYLKQKFVQIWQRNRKKCNSIAPPKMNFSTKCPHCRETPILPRHAGCEHIFCYYCLKAYFTAIESFPCPECDIELRAENMKTL